MSQRFPYFPLYVLDFIGDANVDSMTSEQLGCYVRLLCKAWHQEPVGSIPDENSTLAAWCRVSKSKFIKLAPAVLKPFKKGEDGRYHQKRMCNEYEKLRSEWDRRSSAGKRGMSTRWAEKKDNSVIVPLLTETPSVNNNQNQNQNQIVNTNTPLPPMGSGGESEVDPVPVKPDKPPKREVYPPEFEAWWLAYPRREGKKKALAAWRKAVSRIQSRFDGHREIAVEFLQAAAAEFAAAKAGGDQQFIPWPERWLSHGRYDDDRAAWSLGSIAGAAGGRPGAFGAVSGANGPRVRGGGLLDQLKDEVERAGESSGGNRAAVPARPD